MVWIQLGVPPLILADVRMRNAPTSPPLSPLFTLDTSRRDLAVSVPSTPMAELARPGRSEERVDQTPMFLRRTQTLSFTDRESVVPSPRMMIPDTQPLRDDADEDMNQDLSDWRQSTSPKMGTPSTTPDMNQDLSDWRQCTTPKMRTPSTTPRRSDSDAGFSLDLSFSPALSLDDEVPVRVHVNGDTHVDDRFLDLAEVPAATSRTFDPIVPESPCNEAAVATAIDEVVRSPSPRARSIDGSLSMRVLCTRTGPSSLSPQLSPDLHPASVVTPMARRSKPLPRQNMIKATPMPNQLSLLEPFDVTDANGIDSKSIESSKAQCRDAYNNAPGSPSSFTGSPSSSSDISVGPNIPATSPPRPTSSSAHQGRQLSFQTITNIAVLPRISVSSIPLPLSSVLTLAQTPQKFCQSEALPARSSPRTKPAQRKRVIHSPLIVGAKRPCFSPMHIANVCSESIVHGRISGDKNLFRPISAFLLTGFDKREFKHEKDILVKLIKSFGGEITQSVSDSGPCGETKDSSIRLVIARGPAWTTKVYYTLCRGVAPVKPSWVTQCTQRGELLPIGPFAWFSEVSSLSLAMSPLRPDKRLLASMSIAYFGTNKTEFLSVLHAAGARSSAAQKYKGRSVNLIIFGGADAHPGALSQRIKLAVKAGIPVVDVAWLKECLLLQQVLSFTDSGHRLDQR